MAKARAMAAAPAPKKPTSREMAEAIRTKVEFKQRFPQEHFIEAGTKLAEELGWAGEGHFVLNDIQVSDAQKYLTQVLHETHIGALTPARPGPTAEQVCEHLNLTETDDLAIVIAALEAVVEAEAEAAKSAAG